MSYENELVSFLFVPLQVYDLRPRNQIHYVVRLIFFNVAFFDS